LAELIERLCHKTFFLKRSAGRFNALQPEPRPGMRAGHIPGSLNMPFNRVLKDGKHLEYLEIDALKALFSSYPIKDQQRLIFSCGSGITASIIFLAAYLAGFPHLALYDGSWSEWGADVSLPVA
jgi:thiosulfate/3-mercaptopyruvate sulfurtransferase